MFIGSVDEVDGVKVIAIGMTLHEYQDLLKNVPLIAELKDTKVFITCAETEKELVQALVKANEDPSEEENKEDARC